MEVTAYNLNGRTDHFRQASVANKTEQARKAYRIQKKKKKKKLQYFFFYFWYPFTTTNRSNSFITAFKGKANNKEK